MATTLHASLERFPAESPLRDLVSQLMSDELFTRQMADYHQKRCVDESEAHALLRAATELEFPELIGRDAASGLLTILWETAFPSLIAPAREAYATAGDEQRLALLTLFAATRSREGATVLIECLQRYGWPSPVYGRLFDEIKGLSEFADDIYPVLFGTGKHTESICLALLECLEEGRLKPAQFRGAAFETAAAAMAIKLRKLLTAVRSLQRDEGTAWRFSDSYADIRGRAGVLLDLAGWLDIHLVKDQLKKAVEFSDPRLVAFAVGALVRQGQPVSKRVLARVAECNETRGLLFEKLESLDRLDLFPESMRSWDAMAAATMVEWLCYPTELGREPDAIEKMAIFTCKQGESEAALYVWRFLADGKWLAGTSGPHPINKEPSTKGGHLTFSRFEEWDSGSAAGHAAACMDTMDRWIKHYEAGNEES